MTATTPTRSTDERARLGIEIQHRIEPGLTPQATGKFVAIDVNTEDYEVDADDHAALSRLLARKPSADVWLACVGQPTAFKMRTAR